MAKKQKIGDPNTSSIGVSASDLKRAVDEILRQKQNASEYNGLAGKATANAIERLSLDRKALSIVVGLKRLDDAKRQATLLGRYRLRRQDGILRSGRRI